MKIAICSLATLMFLGVAGVANADQFDIHRTATNEGFSQHHDANYERRNSDWGRDSDRVGDNSTAASVTAAPEISSASAISALVLLGGALILLHGRHSINPKT
jgi:hypothetical protein